MSIQTIDIVMTTRNRPEYLKRSLETIFERTKHPYAMHVIDDASEDGETVPYLMGLYRENRIATVVLRNDRAGIMANKNLSTWLSFSDPFVITADDLLCPKLEPCWLERGVTAIMARPNLAELDLNHPGAFRIKIVEDSEVTFCQALGGTFGFLRKGPMLQWALPHYKGNFGGTDEITRSNYLRGRGFDIGYLTNVFCYHIGEKSCQTGGSYGGILIEVKDWDTLEPVENP